MSSIHCIVRAYADEPLDRYVHARERDLLFVARRNDVETVENAGAIGFPRDAVFAFDDGLFEDLRHAYISAEFDRLSALWRRAQPLEQSPPVLERVG